MTETEDVDETFVVYNPGDTIAEVDLTIVPNETERFGAIEPFTLSIPPGAFQEVDIDAGTPDRRRHQRGAEGESEGDPVLLHGARLESVNDVPVVVERVIVGADESSRPGFDMTFGAPLLMEEAVLAASSTDQAVIVDNPSGSTPVRVTFRSLDGGTLGESSTATDLEVPVAGRLVVTLDELGLGSDVGPAGQSDGPVSIERRIVIGDPADTSGAIAVPLAGHGLRAARPVRLMLRLLPAVVLATVVALVAVWLQRRRPGAAPVVERHHVPTSVDRADFVRPTADWLVVVFTSATCGTCAATWEVARQLDSPPWPPRRSRWAPQPCSTSATGSTPCPPPWSVRRGGRASVVPRPGHRHPPVGRRGRGP